MHALLLVSLLSQPFSDPHSSSGTTGTFTAAKGFKATGACATMVTGDVCCYDNNGVTCSVPTGDTAPLPLYVDAERNNAQGSQVAAPLVLIPGIDEHSITITNSAACAGDTVDVYVYTIASNVATATKTTFTEDGVGGTSTTWNRGASNNACATNLAAKLNALAGISSSAVAAKIGVTPNAKTLAVVLVSASDCLTESNGTGVNGTQAPIAAGGLIQWNLPYEDTTFATYPNNEAMEINPWYSASVPFVLASRASPNVNNARPDNVAVFGWNCSSGGGAKVAGETSGCLHFENSYQYGAGAAQVSDEFHYAITRTNGTVFKPLTGQYKIDTDAWSFSLNTGSVAIEPAGSNQQNWFFSGTILWAGQQNSSSYVIKPFNNVGFLYQSNAALTDYLGELKVDSSDHIHIGDFSYYATATAASVDLGGAVKVIAPKGASTNCPIVQQTLTFAANPGDASKVTSGLIPAGAVLNGVTARVIVAGTNCASWEAGDGTTVDQYCPSGTSKALGTTCDPTNSKTDTVFPAFKRTSREVTLTAVTGNCFDLSVRVSAHYCVATADTAN